MSNWPLRVAIALCLVPAVLVGQGAAATTAEAGRISSRVSYAGGETRIDDVRLRAVLQTSANQRVRTVPLVPVASESGRIVFTARFPLADVRPGEYVLDIEARTPRHTVNRRVPFSVE